MKRISVLIFLILAESACYGQNKKIDSLKQLLQQEHTDTAKIQKLILIGWAYHDIRNDSGIIYLQEALSHSLNIGYKQGEIRARHYFAYFLYDVNSDYATALDLFFKNLQVIEQTTDTSFYIFDTRFLDTRGIGFVYEQIKNFDKQLEYTIKLRDLVKPGIIKDSAYTQRLNSILNNRFGSVYVNLNKLDSSKYYYLKIFNLCMQNNIFEGIALSASGIGNVFAKKNAKDSAVYYYHIAASAALAANRKDVYNEDLFFLGKFFWQSKNTDSAFFYAQHSFNLSKQQRHFDLMVETATLLANIYYANKQTDSAYKYLNLSMHLKDSLFNENKTAQIQNLSLKISVQNQQEEQAKKQAVYDYQAKIKMYSLLAGLVVLLIVSLLLLRNNKQKHNAAKKITQAYEELKSTQAQLIQSEKMASLGELTAGIAHEIQNPLNFVNNFSDVNKELLEELKVEADKGHIDEVKAIANDVIGNEEKINHHGKRADAIVKGMLQHSRTNTGQKEPTDINKLADEYLRLAYHGLRAKDKSFNATLKTEFDSTIEKVNIIPQDIGRVMLNLLTNAFYAVNKKKSAFLQQKDDGMYEPTVWVNTKKSGDKILITVQDNGHGVSHNVLDKIFQPFFTTKPTGQGTGLGLSLSYDIVKAHGGEIKVESKENEGATFIIQLPTEILKD